MVKNKEMFFKYNSKTRIAHKQAHIIKCFKGPKNVPYVKEPGHE